MANNCFQVKETGTEMDETAKIKSNVHPYQGGTQPLILGNVNAANLLTSNVTDTQSSVLIPTALMTLPTGVNSNNNNQVIGILPVILQGSQISGNLNPSRVVNLNNNLAISCDTGVDNCSNAAVCVSSQPTYHSSTVPLPSTLGSSDTLILSSSASKLASADTLPLLPSASDIMRDKYPIIAGQFDSKGTSTSMQATFSLVSDISNSSVDLESISTINLFKIDSSSRENVKCVVATDTSQKNSSKTVRKHLSKSSRGKRKMDASSRGYRTRSKSKQKGSSESDTNQLQIDEDTDTEVDNAFSTAKETEKKENSLTRDDTVILSTAAQTQIRSSLTECDTLIISSNCSQANVYNNAASKPVISSCVGQSNETSFSISNSVVNDLRALLSVSGGRIVTQPTLPSVSSIPSLMLTESMVEGTVNPTLICNLLSQSSEKLIHVPSLKSLSVDQIVSSDSSLGSVQQIPMTVSSQSSLQGNPVSVSLQCPTQQNISSSSLVSNTSVKGTQTDWILGIDQFPVPVVQNSSPALDNGHGTVTVIQPVEEPQFPCVNCELKFSSKLELKKHEKEAHKNILKCELCSSTFTRLGNYTRHKKIHNLKPDQKRYTCTECGREFLQRCDMKRHLLIHSNQQPHRCKICDKGYIRHSDLVVHMRFHNKVKDFACTMCDKKFFQSGDLNRHIRRAHRPATQLTCGHCERKYACEVTLIRHMKLVHKDIILKSVNEATGKK